MADTQPVFERILDSVERLFDIRQCSVILARDGMLHMVARRGSGAEGVDRLFPAPLAQSKARDVIGTGRQVYVSSAANAEELPLSRRVAEAMGDHSLVMTPMVWERQAVGMISVARAPNAVFSEKELALLQTFADQAVIAIENVRLFNETKEALAHQTATSEVLQAIGNSMADTQPVFERILDSVERLFDIRQCAVMLAAGDGMLHLAARRGIGVEAMDRFYPVPLAQTMAGDVVETGQQTYVASAASALASPLMRRVAGAAGDFSVVLTPMLWEGRGIGVINLSRAPNATFSEKELALLRTFADQAVIAIQNARLFNETREALGRQTATADVLKVISRSAFDLNSVMDTLTSSAAELCKAEVSALYLREGDVLVARGVAHADVAQVDFLRRTPLQIGDSTYIGRTFQAGTVRNIADVATETETGQLKGFGEILGFRSIVFVPLMRESRGVGIFALARMRTGQFSQREVELVQTFADQAVIAIENVRLFDEVQAKTRDLTEALTYQTGSANILSVIASSPTEIEPVLKAIVESACGLCDAI